MAGGALLQQSNLTRNIFRTLVDAVDKPVTLKMRAGVTSASKYSVLGYSKNSRRGRNSNDNASP